MDGKPKCPLTDEWISFIHTYIYLYVYIYSVCVLSHVQLFVTPWTVARQVPLSMGILQTRTLEWVPCLPPGDLPDPGIEPGCLAFPELQADCFYF